MRQRVTHIFFIMLGILNIFQTKEKRFVTEGAFRSNLKNQSEMNRQLLLQLRKQNVTEEKQCRIEYFFYADKEANGKELCRALISIGYTSSCKVSSGDKRLFVINGWTNKITMSDSNLSGWSERMCTIGYKYDCDFDGWGTDDF